MENLTLDELVFLAGLVDEYLEHELDLSQREWGMARGVLDKLDAEVESRP